MIKSLNRFKPIIDEHIKNLILGIKINPEVDYLDLMEYVSLMHHQYLKSNEQAQDELADAMKTLNEQSQLEENKPSFAQDNIGMDYTLIHQPLSNPKDLIGFAIFYPFGIPEYRGPMKFSPLLHINLINMNSDTYKFMGEDDVDYSGPRTFHLFPYNYEHTSDEGSPLSLVRPERDIKQRIRVNKLSPDFSTFDELLLSSMEDAEIEFKSGNMEYAYAPLIPELRATENFSYEEHEKIRLAYVVYPIYETSYFFANSYI